MSSGPPVLQRRAACVLLGIDLVSSQRLMVRFAWRLTKNGNLSMAHAGLRAVLFEGKRGWGYGIYLQGAPEPVWGSLRYGGEGEARCAAEIDFVGRILERELANPPRPPNEVDDV
jgi:hypothetical protein